MIFILSYLLKIKYNLVLLTEKKMQLFKFMPYHLFLLNTFFKKHLKEEDTSRAKSLYYSLNSSETFVVNKPGYSTEEVQKTTGLINTNALYFSYKDCNMEAVELLLKVFIGGYDDKIEVIKSNLERRTSNCAGI